MTDEPLTGVYASDQPLPSVGRIVHYVSRGSADGKYPIVCRAAVIAGLNGVNQPCDLVVFNPEGLFFNRCPQREDVHVGGSWHFPERVGEL